MDSSMKVLFWIFAFFIAYTMVGYPVLLQILNKVLPHKKLNLNSDYSPTVTVIVPAHNEDSVIEKKILNLLDLNYDSKKLDIIIASDNSTDSTNEITRKYESKYSGKVRLYVVKDRKGKTNAQDEAVKIATGEVIIFTDANSMLDSNSVKQLVISLSDNNVGYVAGKLVYTNNQENITSESEASYWNIDLYMRKIESDLSSITAGNGSIYGVRKKDYMEINPIYSHDSIFPPKFVISGKRAIYNEKAIAYEKAGENDGDEFQRKVRMSRKIIMINYIDFEKYNIFKHSLFTLFYFSHRTLRNNLYLMHIIIFLLNLFLVIATKNLMFIVFFLGQLAVYLIAFLGRQSNNKYIKFISYYIMTILAQLVGALKEISGKSKPFWEKAESTR
ncbi:glycosyltransferase [Enterococcus hirae]|uniref:glycosyltransferase n=1 Tax=Enterococcus lactis TaxID=357441 RepID=UPI0034E9487B